MSNKINIIVRPFDDSSITIEVRKSKDEYFDMLLTISQIETEDWNLIQKQLLAIGVEEFHSVKQAIETAIKEYTNKLDEEAELIQVASVPNPKNHYSTLTV